MKRLLAVLLVLPCVAWGNHAVPRGGYVNGSYNGSNTFILMPSGFEHDPEMINILDIQAALRNQGYDAESGMTSFSNLTGYFDTHTLLTIDQAAGYLQNFDTPVRVLVTYQHGSGNPAVISWELYSYTQTGLQTRDARWTELSAWYEQNVEIFKTVRTGDNPFFGIGVTPAFFQRLLAGQGIPAPDIYHLVGCNTASSDWRNLINDTGVRCLALMSDDVVYGIENGPDFEVTAPWTRMDGRNWWGGIASKRLRTAPRAFQTTFTYNGQTYLVRQNPQRPLWEMHFAAGVDSMALSPTLFSLNLTQNQEIRQNPFLVTARFSCPMWQDHTNAMIKSTQGAYVYGEHWNDDGTQLLFSLRSVRVYPWSEAILRGENYPYKFLCSAEGYRSVCFSGHGPVGPYGHDSTTVVNTTYNDPNYAAAYDDIAAWREGPSVKVWVQGTEVGTARHVILGGSSQENMTEVASIPGSGIKHFECDELVTISGDNIRFVQVREEPDNSSSRIADVLDREPAVHQGHVHSSHVDTFTPPRSGSCESGRGGDAFLEVPQDNTWVLYGPSTLLNYFQSHGGSALLTRQGLNPVYLPTTTHDGWELHAYLVEYQAQYRRVPKGATIIGGGKDSPDNPRNDISPYQYPCESCYWHNWQSGDVFWGVDDNFW